MINARSMMMLIDDMTRRYKHFYAPMVTMIIRVASLYGVIVVFAYLFQIHYAPSTLAGLIILAPYIFIIGLLIVVYVYFIASAPGFFLKYLMMKKDWRQVDKWLPSFLISIAILICVVLLWIFNEGSSSTIIVNSVVTLTILVISWITYKIAGRHFNEKSLLKWMAAIYIFMILLVVIKPYPTFLM